MRGGGGRGGTGGFIQTDKKSIGVLDIYVSGMIGVMIFQGFEIFQQNGFEQVSLEMTIEIDNDSSVSTMWMKDFNKFSSIWLFVKNKRNIKMKEWR